MHLFGYRVEELTFARFLADRASEFGQRTALRFLHDGREYSYRDLDLLSNSLANGLMGLGVRHGMKVALMMDNCPEIMLSCFALAKLGAVAVPMNPSARGHLLAGYLAQSDCTAAIVEQRYAGRIADIGAELPSLQTLVVHRPADEPLQAVVGHANVVEFAPLLQASASAPQTDVKYSDLAMLSFTSGTTGPSKAIQMAQATCILFGMTTAETYGYRPSDTTYVCLPLNHANALLFASYGTLVGGGTIALSKRFSVSRYWQEMHGSGATVTNLLGSMTSMLWNQPPQELERQHRLRLVSMIPVTPFASEFESRFNTRIASAYGISDYAIATIFSPLDPVSKLGSAGRPRAGIELRIVDDHDRELPEGEVGEIVLRSHNAWGITQGYYKQPEATLAAYRNQWFHTGDRGRLDADGYLFFADRKKDSIRRRGENISAFEVEMILARHPSVAEVAAYPVSSEMSEDEVCVSVTLKEGMSATARELVEFSIQHMAHYMVPRFVSLISELPRTATQKVEKTVLKSEAAAARASGQLWDREREGIVVKR